VSVATATPLRLAGDRKCPVIAYRVDWDLLASVPGFKHLLAEVFIAETGGHMKQFPTARQSASWAGVCPGSQRVRRSSQVHQDRPENRYLTGDLGVVALNKARTDKTRFSAKYHCATNDPIARNTIALSRRPGRPQARSVDIVVATFEVPQPLRGAARRGSIPEPGANTTNGYDKVLPGQLA